MKLEVPSTCQWMFSPKTQTTASQSKAKLPNCMQCRYHTSTSTPICCLAQTQPSATNPDSSPTWFHSRAQSSSCRCSSPTLHFKSCANSVLQGFDIYLKVYHVCLICCIIPHFMIFFPVPKLSENHCISSTLSVTSETRLPSTGFPSSSFKQCFSLDRYQQFPLSLQISMGPSSELSPSPQQLFRCHKADSLLPQGLEGSRLALLQGLCNTPHPSWKKGQ